MRGLRVKLSIKCLVFTVSAMRGTTSSPGLFHCHANRDPARALSIRRYLFCPCGSFQLIPPPARRSSVPRRRV